MRTLPARSFFFAACATAALFVATFALAQTAPTADPRATAGQPMPPPPTQNAVGEKPATAEHATVKYG